MKKTLALILAVLFILPLCVSCGTAKKESAIIPAEGETVLYVSPTGDDTADGSFDKPLATLEGAKEKVRAILPTAEGVVSVYFREGDYLMTAGVSFDESDSGKDGAPVKYAAYPDEEVRFIGGVKVDPSLITAADPASSVTARVKDETAKAALLQADVSSLTDVYPVLYTYETPENDSINPMELYLGETAILPAHWPNYDNRLAYNYVDIGERYTGRDTVVEPETKHATLYYPDNVAERIAGWSDESVEDLYVYGFLEYVWMADRHEVLGLDREEQSLYLSRGAYMFAHYIESGKAVFFNLPEELDQPGESYVDRDAKIAYFYPTADYDANDVWLSTLVGDMLTFNGTSHVTFEGISMGWTRGNVVMATGLSDFTMKNCRLVHTSAKAGYFYDAKNVRFDGCEIADTAHGGLVLMGGDRDTLESSGIVVENCDIHHFNRDGSTYSPELSEYYYNGGTPYAPGLAIYAVGARISHNKIHDCIHQAVFPESNNIVIEYNEFYNCCTEGSDMGTIYSWGNPTLLGNVIRYNYFHDIGGFYRNVQYSIYCDCGVAGPEIYGNLFVDAGGRTMEENYEDPYGKGVISLQQYTHVHNNVFVDSRFCFRYEDWSAGTRNRQTGWIMFLYNTGWNGKYGGGMDIESRFREVDFENDAWKTAYAGTQWEDVLNFFSWEMADEFAALTDKQKWNKAAGMAPSRTNEVNDNILVHIDSMVTLNPNDQKDNLIYSLNAHENIFDGDPAWFVDYDGGDFHFTEDALAAIRETCPNFEPLPLDEIGPQ